MSDGSRIRNAAPAPQPSPADPGVTASDAELDLFLIRVRMLLGVRAAVIGVAGASVEAAGPRLDGEDPASLRICAAIPLALRPDEPLGILILADDATRRLTEAATRRLADLAGEAALLLARRRDAAAIADLRRQADRQGRLIAEQAAALAHSRKVFERASAAARIGVWECSLPDETLSWTDGVYDIFELPRGAPIERARALACYPEASRALLERTRSRAIAERGGFTLDAEIVTFKGRHRWIRLTATVECENGVPVRIFGMKQDITEEKTLADRTRYLAEFDVMTGLANRTQFQSRLGALAGQGGTGALLLVDLDGFKQINDTYGHAIGDECLREAALRLRGVCAEADLIARIGGDEFAVLLGPGLAPGAAEALAGRIVEALGQPVEGAGGLFRLGGSVGIAWSGAATASDLFVQADAALYAAKAAGRRTFRVFGPSPAASLEPDASARLPNRHAAATPP